MTTETLSKEAIALREQAAAKFKEAKDYSDSLSGRKSDTGEPQDASEEELQKFDGLTTEARTLDGQFKAKAKDEGLHIDLREGMEFYYSKATGGGKLPWHQVNVREIAPTMGQEYVESEAYKALIKSGRLTSEKAQYGQLSDAVVLGKAAGDLIQSESGGPGAAL